MQNPQFGGAKAAQHLEPDESEFPGTSGPVRAADVAFRPRWGPEHTATGSKAIAAYEEGAPGTGSKCSRFDIPRARAIHCTWLAEVRIEYSGKQIHA